MKYTVLLINGPNLNLLGTREPEVYGRTTLKEVEKKVTECFSSHSIACLTYQSNIEGEIINYLHDHRQADFLIINPGAFTHTSIALRDAILGVSIPFVEVHISNVYQREAFRHHSYFSDIAIGSIIGLGIHGYELAAQFAIRRLLTP
ncbi:type II 3-dehydroquinate dehydratase [Deltaproteobacteria bacterium TL4]